MTMVLSVKAKSVTRKGADKNQVKFTQLLFHAIRPLSFVKCYSTSIDLVSKTSGLHKEIRQRSRLDGDAHLSTRSTQKHAHRH